MVGYLTQLRAVSFVTGLGVAGGLYLSTRRLLWRSTADVADSLPGAPPPPGPVEAVEPLFGPLHRAYLVRKWNQAVDATFTPLIQALSKRNL